MTGCSCYHWSTCELLMFHSLTSAISMVPSGTGDIRRIFQSATFGPRLPGGKISNTGAGRTSVCWKVSKSCVVALQLPRDVDLYCSRLWQDQMPSLAKPQSWAVAHGYLCWESSGDIKTVDSLELVQTLHSCNTVMPNSWHTLSNQSHIDNIT